jgi:glycosyltransferase involved in cell wall biosynthesis
MLADELRALGGLERVQLETARGLKQRNHEIDLFYTAGGNLAADWATVARRRMQVRPYRLHAGEARAWGGSILRSAGLGRAWRPDIVYASVHPQVPHALAAGWSARAPVACHLHGPPPRAVLAPHHRVILHGTRRFLAVSRFTADQWIAAGLPADRLDIVWNGVDIDHYRPGDWRTARKELGIPLEAFVVAYVGRIDPTKGVHVLLDAWRHLGLSSNQGCLLLAGAATGQGQGYSSALIAAADPTTTRWLGHLADVRQLFHATDVVVVPSVYPEPFPLVVLEAMACGTPVVASRVGGMPEALTGQLSTHLVQPGDAAALAALLARFQGWRELRPELGTAGRRQVEERFDHRRWLTTVEDLLLQMIQKPDRARAGAPTS